MLSKEIKETLKESVLCWLATANSAGEPNVSPKEMFIPYGDKHLLIANIASPVSVGNIRENPRVCVSFIQIFKQKGFKLEGVGGILEAGDEGYAEKVALLKQSGGEGFPIKGIIQVEVTSVSPIIAPSYWLFPDKTTEATQIEQSLNTYGVQK